jgi:hypothetical protein
MYRLCGRLLVINLSRLSLTNSRNRGIILLLYLNLDVVVVDAPGLSEELSAEEIRERISLLQLAVKGEVRKGIGGFEKGTPERTLLKDIFEVSRATFDQVRAVFGHEVDEVSDEDLHSFLNGRMEERMDLSFSGEEGGVRLDSKKVEVVDGKSEEFEYIKVDVLEFLETKAKKGAASNKLLELLVGQRYGRRISELEEVIPDYALGIVKLISNTNYWVLKDLGVSILIRNGVAILSRLDSVLKLERPEGVEKVENEGEGADADGKIKKEAFEGVKGHYERVLESLTDISGGRPVWNQMLGLVCDNALVYEEDGSDYGEVEDRFKMIDGIVRSMQNDSELIRKGFRIYVDGVEPKEDEYDERVIRVRFHK